MLLKQVLQKNLNDEVPMFSTLISLAGMAEHGRRKGLKIPRSFSTVPVRFRLPALENTNRNNTLIIDNWEKQILIKSCICHCVLMGR